MSVKLENISFYYNPNSKFEHQALNEVNLEIPDKRIYALIGETGSGKTTLVQQFNGLLFPTFGKLTFEVDKFDETTNENKKTILYQIDRPVQFDKKGRKLLYKDKKIKDVKTLRKTVGLVFQFPEYQLFETSVLADVMYGPLNLGFKKDEAEKLAKEALELVGIKEEYYNRSPFDLSGGEKRKVAIAGVIAMKPEYLILDEPTAGLDPNSERKMMQLFKKINDDGTGIIIVTHNMDIVLRYVDEVFVIDKGTIIFKDTPNKLFENHEFINSSSLEIPLVIKVANALKEKGLDLNLDVIKDIKTLTSEIVRCKK